MVQEDKEKIWRWPESIPDGSVAPSLSEKRISGAKNSHTVLDSGNNTSCVKHSDAKDQIVE
jgi:hypothetical protein